MLRGMAEIHIFHCIHLGPPRIFVPSRISIGIVANNLRRVLRIEYRSGKDGATEHILIVETLSLCVSREVHHQGTHKRITPLTHAP